ncbi:hypothetical protein [Tunturiibacter lichenicola]|uniref:hypothetical protein n=1 Tax=Tunturiibacter lichenicola TaxID=2051959 RepID=UPI003D9B7E4A
MTVNDFAKILRHPAARLESEDYYVAHKTGQTGYKAHFRLHDLWYWYSVSGTSVSVSRFEVADAITHPDCSVDREGSYKREKGFEATVRLNGHSYMLGHGNNRPFGKKEI